MEILLQIVQIENGIGHQLAWSMPGHVAAALNMKNALLYDNDDINTVFLLDMLICNGHYQQKE